MKNVGSRLKRISIKLAMVLILAILINVAFIANDSFSFFTNEASSKVQVKAASTEDILEKFEIKNDKAGNAQSIIIRRTQNLQTSPIIYFGVDGELSDYILHINPVKLEEYKDYQISIKVNGSGAKGNRDDVLRGTITAYYLNGFISEVREISMSKRVICKGEICSKVKAKVKASSKEKQNLDSSSEAKIQDIAEKEKVNVEKEKDIKSDEQNKEAVEVNKNEKNKDMLEIKE